MARAKAKGTAKATAKGTAKVLEARRGQGCASSSPATALPG
jgi:hypothetical protein